MHGTCCISLGPKSSLRTGVLPQHINTVFRIGKILDSAGSAARSEDVRALLVPDLWCALLTGTQAVDSQHHMLLVLARLDTELLDAVGVDASVFPPVMENRVVVGELGKELAAKIGPAINGRLYSWPRMTQPRPWRRLLFVNTAFVSSGTWSLVGVA